MPLINTSVSNLIQGVSQQPDAVRFSGQCEEQENALASVVDGLQKRPAAKHVATLISEAALDDNAKVHFIERDNKERYVIIIKGDDLKTITAYNLFDGAKASISQKYRGVVESFQFELNNAAVGGKSSCRITFTEDCPVTVPKASTSLLGVARLVGGGGFSTDEFPLINIAHREAGDVAFTQLSKRQILIELPEDDVIEAVPAVMTDIPGTDPVRQEITTPAVPAYSQSLTLFGAGTGELQTVIEYTILSPSAGDLELDVKNYLNVRDTYYETLLPQGGVTTPKEDLKLLTKGDITYILNTQKPVRLDHSRTRTVDSDALVYVKQGDYEKKYGVRVEVDGESPHYENYVYSGASQSSTGEEDELRFFNTAKNAQSDYILETLFSDSAANVKDAAGDNNVNPNLTGEGEETHQTNLGLLHGSGEPEGWSANATPFNPLSKSDTTFTPELLAPQIGIIRGPSRPNYTIYPVDSAQGANMGVVHKAVTAVTDLPKVAPHRFKTKVQGDVEEATDDRYVQFLVAGSNSSTATGTVGQGGWSEIGGSGVWNRISADTMPLMLRSTAENTFELAHMPLDELLAGDANTNPHPSFIGSPINGMFHYKGRLGFLSGASISMSEVKFGSYDGVHGTQHYNFYRTSVTSLLDSDPIDVTVSSTEVVNLRDAVAFQDSLVVFSDYGQFALRSGDILTSSTVSVNPITRFECDRSVSPIALGAYIYFPFSRGDNIGVREFTVNANTDVFDANEITSHVPQYIPQKRNILTDNLEGLVSMTGSSSEELMALTDGTDIYIYKYFFSGDEKVLSSWSKFTLGGEGIRGVGFVDSDLFVVQALSETNQTHLLKIPLANRQRDAEGYNTHLDRRVELELRGDAAIRTLTVPYLLADGETLQAYTKDGLLVQGLLPEASGESTIITFEDDRVSSGIPVSLNVDVTYPGTFTRRGETFTNPGAEITDAETQALDLQTSTHWQAVTVTNNGTEEIPSFRLFVNTPNTSVGNPVRLYGGYSPEWTDGGTIENRRFLYYPLPLAAGASTNITILYSTLGGTFTPEFTIGVPGNELYVGIPYTMKYTFSEQVFKTGASDKPSPTNSGRMLIRNGSLFFTDTGHFVVKVTPDLRDTAESEFNASVIQSTTEGSMPLESNSFRFPVFTDPKGTVITIENATAAPCNLQSAEFESFIHQRSRRYG